MIHVSLMYSYRDYEEVTTTPFSDIVADENHLEAVAENTVTLLEGAADNLRRFISIERLLISKKMEELVSTLGFCSGGENVSRLTAVINPTEAQLQLLSLGRPNPDFPLLTVFSDRVIMEASLEILGRISRIPIIHGTRTTFPKLFRLYQPPNEDECAENYEENVRLVEQVMQTIPA